MSEEIHLSEHDDLQQRLAEVQHLIARQRVVETLVHRQDMPHHELVENMVHKQHENELRHKLDSMHPADVAYVLEALPLAEEALMQLRHGVLRSRSLWDTTLRPPETMGDHPLRLASTWEARGRGAASASTGRPQRSVPHGPCGARRGATPLARCLG